MSVLKCFFSLWIISQFLGESAQKQGTPERYTANIEDILKNQFSYSRPLSPSSDDYAH